MIDWWFRSRTSGELVVAQRPNVMILVFVGATVAGRLAPRAVWSARAEAVASVALAAWSLDELLRGVNPYRRVIGAGGLVAAARRLRD